MHSFSFLKSSTIGKMLSKKTQINTRYNISRMQTWKEADRTQLPPFQKEANSSSKTNDLVRTAEAMNSGAQASQGLWSLLTKPFPALTGLWKWWSQRSEPLFLWIMTFWEETEDETVVLPSKHSIYNVAGTAKHLWDEYIEKYITLNKNILT